MKNLVVEYKGIPSVSHLVVAENTSNETRSVSKIITNYLKDFEEFGAVRFEIATEHLGLHEPSANKFLANQARKIYWLNEEQATLLLTYLQNTPIVREFKKALIKEFYQIKKHFAIGKEQFDQSLTLIASAMQTMLKQNSAILELLRQKNEGEFKLCDKPISRVYHKRLSNEEKFLEKVIALLRKDEGLSQGELLARIGRRKDDRTALRWLHSYDGIYWRANLLDAGKYTYSYSLIEE